MSYRDLIAADREIEFYATEVVLKELRVAVVDERLRHLAVMGRLNLKLALAKRRLEVARAAAAACGGNQSSAEN